MVNKTFLPPFPTSGITSNQLKQKEFPFGTAFALTFGEPGGLGELLTFTGISGAA